LVARLQPWGPGYYLGKDPEQPQIGDLKITFFLAGDMDVSVLGRQIQNSVAPYQATSGTELFRIEPGLVPADVMFQHAADENVLLAWLLRGGGFLAMLIGLVLVFRPLVTLAEIVPPLGRIVGAGVGLTAVALSIALTLASIGLAWLAYRPLWGGAALAAAVVLFVLLKRLGRNHGATPATRATAS
jgi:hypothetical protein